MKLTSLKLISLLFACTFNCLGFLGAEEKPDWRVALNEAGSLKTWQAVYTSYTKYHRFDDGAIAEGYSESITALLAKHWKSTDELRKLTDKDKQFLEFVLRHIDSTADTGNLRKIEKNAQRPSPESRKALNSAIGKAAKESLLHLEPLDNPK